MKIETLWMNPLVAVIDDVFDAELTNYIKGVPLRWNAPAWSIPEAEAGPAGFCPCWLLA